MHSQPYHPASKHYAELSFNRREQGDCWEKTVCDWSAASSSGFWRANNFVLWLDETIHEVKFATTERFYWIYHQSRIHHRSLVGSIATASNTSPRDVFSKSKAVQTVVDEVGYDCAFVHTNNSQVVALFNSLQNRQASQNAFTVSDLSTDGNGCLP